MARNPRRFVDWSRVRGPREALAVLVATALGAGLVPFAPGTMGSLVGLPLCYLSNPWSWPARAAVWIAIVVAGTWAAGELDRTMGSRDNQVIVIDEVAGVGLAALSAGQDWRALAAAFVLFRVFDILKPPPVRQLDRWSKKHARNRWVGGFGVIADDLVAGLQALACVAALQYLGVL